MKFTTSSKSKIFLSITILLFACSQLACSAGKTKSDAPEPEQSPGEDAESRDDGTQVQAPFRLNYAGYLPLQEKIAVYISDETSPRKWVVKNRKGRTVAKGSSNERRENDHASGDTFFLIDFSALSKVGKRYYLEIDGQKSAPFDISNDPYGGLKYEVFDYFKDHRRRGDVFDRFVDNWTDYSLTLDFIADAGDQGYYTVNAADAQWSLMNLLERYPEVNNYYQSYSSEMDKVYDDLFFFNGPMMKVIFPGQKLAVAKLATNSNDTWAKCPGVPGDGPCVSKPETKATFSVARSLAAMSRLDAEYGSQEDKKAHYSQAKTALKNAETAPFVCLTWEGFGGEGGYYPNNDNWSLWRDPRSHRDPCASGKVADPLDNNTNDDHYAALVELYLAANKFGLQDDAEKFKKKLEAHSHHGRVQTFFFGAVSTEATLSLLTHRPEGMDLSKLEANVLAFADDVLKYQEVGYPGVTFDTQSDFWDSQDNDNVDNNFRWASNRMQLNDARIVMFAAEIARENKDYKKAADYTNAVLKVLDQISGTNAVALAMYTSDSYPHIEHAVSRTHDGLVPDTEDGKMALGPNNWTLSNDPNMPTFGSQPGMKMFAMTGTGWASREISIDGNASLVPIMYFATEVAPGILEEAAKKK